MPQTYFWQWHGWWFFPMFIPLFWLGVIAIVLYLIFGRHRLPGPGPEPETALDILKKLYAKGEITKAEFEEMKRDIM
jgi:putative membrane protein